jgi:hypothetical protein
MNMEGVIEPQLANGEAGPSKVVRPNTGKAKMLAVREASDNTG